MKQGTPEWFLSRCGRITASRFADVMARTKSGPAAARANLVAQLAVERITGQPVDTYTNAAMQRGTELEPEARAAYEAHTRQLVEECGFIQHPDLDYVGCSPDGLLGEDRLVEFKCPASMAKHAEYLLSAKLGDEYWWQLQGQLWVTERKSVDICSYDPRFPAGLQLAIVFVDRDEHAIDVLAAECAKVNAEIEDLVRQLTDIIEKQGD